MSIKSRMNGKNIAQHTNRFAWKISKQHSIAEINKKYAASHRGSLKQAAARTNSHPFTAHIKINMIANA